MEISENLPLFFSLAVLLGKEKQVTCKFNSITIGLMVQFDHNRADGAWNL